MCNDRQGCSSKPSTLQLTRLEHMAQAQSDGARSLAAALRACRHLPRPCGRGAERCKPSPFPEHRLNVLSFLAEEQELWEWSRLGLRGPVWTEPTVPAGRATQTESCFFREAWVSWAQADSVFAEVTVSTWPVSGQVPGAGDPVFMDPVKGVPPGPE